MTVALFCTRKDEQEVKSNAGTGAFGQLCLLRSRKSHEEFALHCTEQCGPKLLPHLLNSGTGAVQHAKNCLKLFHPVLWLKH